MALVIGNSNYRSSTVSPLLNPIHDAQDLSNLLRSLNFQVISILDGTREEMAMAVDDFSRALNNAELGLFFFAGHGVQIDGKNYLIPVDAELPTTRVVPFRTLSADEVLSAMAAGGARINLFLLDACRDNPIPAETRSLQRGLAVVQSRPPETMIVYATQPNATADDGTGRNSPFTQALLDHLPTPGLDIYDLYRNVSSQVQRQTNGRQIPEQLGNITARFSLVPGQPPTNTTSLSTLQSSQQQFLIDQGALRLSVSSDATISIDGEAFGALSSGQSGTLSGLPTGLRTVQVTYLDGYTEQTTVMIRKDLTTEIRFQYLHIPAHSSWTNPSGIRFLPVEGGTFEMGARTGGNPDERPTRLVELSTFLMSETEITQGQWEQVMGNNPSDPSQGLHPQLPVNRVSFYDILLFANTLSIREGRTPVYSIRSSIEPQRWGSVPIDREVAWDNVTVNWTANGYRLPTEAEWEFAARGGNNSQNRFFAGSDSVSDVAWFRGNTSQLQRVGSLQPNELGLYDMSGNVSEWVWDWYGSYQSHDRINPIGPQSGTNRVLRGGNWSIRDDLQLRPTQRAARSPWFRGASYGFRLVIQP